MGGERDRRAEIGCHPAALIRIQKPDTGILRHTKTATRQESVSMDELRALAAGRTAHSHSYATQGLGHRAEPSA